MQQCSESRAYYSYDDDAMAISTLTVHEKKMLRILLTLARSKLGLKKGCKLVNKNILQIGYRDDW